VHCDVLCCACPAQPTSFTHQACPTCTPQHMRCLIILLMLTWTNHAHNLPACLPACRYETTYFAPFPGYYFSGDGARRDADGYYWITGAQLGGCFLCCSCCWRPCPWAGWLSRTARQESTCGQSDGCGTTCPAVYPVPPCFLPHLALPTGRVDDVINVSGHRIGTAEVESALVAHPQCAEAAVVGYEHPVKGQGIWAYVTLLEVRVSVAVLRRAALCAVLCCAGRPDVGFWSGIKMPQLVSMLPAPAQPQLLLRLLCPRGANCCRAWSMMTS
jgi:acyl-CoA synthetase (AMP-forming)/AMP-acid ligase II